jgi:GH24 family phage-related lysozyme (muramidase)
MNEVQQQGVAQTQKYSEAAQPYYAKAAGLTEQAVDATKPLTAAQIQQYQNPYVQSVVDPTLKALQQQQAIDRQGQAAQAIRSGAFGGERAGLQRAVLGGQQELAQAQAISPLYAQAYQQALATAQQQQQQRTAGLMGAGQQIAGIGTGAQQAGLQGAQATIGAGTLGQQTQQALDTAKYQQFLQERGYPFQVAQFLANIAEGTGALSGSTTTTTQPTSFFSDERLKHDIKKVGKTNDGLPIYSFKYNGDDRTQIGLMAQDVEKKRPEAVGLSGGYKTVDYAKATAGARHARAMGGVVPESMGGAVLEPGNFARGGFAYGGYSPSGNVDPIDMQSILQSQMKSFGPFASGGLYGGSAQTSPMGGKVAGIVPSPSLPVPKLVTASPPSRSQQTGLQGAVGDVNAAAKAIESIKNIKSGATELSNWAKGDTKSQPTAQTTPSEAAPKPVVNPADAAKAAQGQQKADFSDDILKDQEITGDFPMAARGGGIMPRHHFAGGGFLDPYKQPTSGSMVPEDVMASSEETKDEAEKLAPKPDGSRGGGGGGGGLGSALGAASSLMTVGKGIGSFASWLPTLFLKDGGTAYRHHFDDGGPVPSTQQQNQDQEHPAYNAVRYFEGYLPKPKYDVNAYRGGYGTDTFTTPEGKVVPVTPDTVFTREDAERDLKRRVPEFQNRVRGQLGEDLYGSLNPHAQAALTSVAYNYGSLPSSVVKAAQAGDASSLAQAVAALPANPSRRALEANMIHPEGDYRPQKGGLEGMKQTIANAIPSAPNAPSGKEQGWGDFLTSPRFLTPLGTGLLTMASSPSRYLGAAMLQGLGAGLAAVQPSEMAAQQIEKQKIDTALGAARLPQEAIFEKGGYVFVTTKDGRVLDYGSWIDAGRPEPIGGSSAAAYADNLNQKIKGGGLAAGAPAAQGTQQQLAGAPKPVEAPKAPGAITLDDAAKAAAAREEQDLYRLPQADRNARIGQNIANVQKLNEARDASHILTGRLNALAHPLGELGTGQQITPGAYASAEYTIKRYFNDALKAAGLPELQVDEQGRINYEKAQKAVEALKAKGVEGLNLRAVSALDELAKGMAEPGKTKEAAASILADTYIDKQRAIDEANITNDYKSGRNLTVAQGANDQYRRIHPDERYDVERKALNKLLTTSLQTGEPLINYFIGQGKDPRITPQVINQLVGADVTRYFQSQPR